MAICEWLVTVRSGFCVMIVELGMEFGTFCSEDGPSFSSFSGQPRSHLLWIILIVPRLTKWGRGTIEFAIVCPFVRPFASKNRQQLQLQPACAPDCAHTVYYQGGEH